tara:strand:- start:3 stop:218 length:216 start_codon:yes stop_codon:yes gene_type:complete
VPLLVRERVFVDEMFAVVEVWERSRRGSARVITESHCSAVRKSSTTYTCGGGVVAHLRVVSFERRQRAGGV